ncbi:hypothetical protein I7I53_00907 [Histoplasma capsulatum var. duboisii H88]|uniref:Uncharacterized protein n=1 Tax=Ajellomyces capsulatus (strain H88) TaxID=544711 RepID=A0A8A1LMD5_AJEC8|nr:hypothetical protein I7I53_00907 [Histoplasma capsulatum var. duboisii H88]
MQGCISNGDVEHQEEIIQASPRLRFLDMIMGAGEIYLILLWCFCKMVVFPLSFRVNETNPCAIIYKRMCVFAVLGEERDMR